MLVNVPQYIDVEDKIAGPLTIKQLGWMLALGISLLILWGLLPAVAFFISGIPLAILFVALAFYKPYGQPLGSFVIFGILYYFRPKIYVWKRTPEREQIVPRVTKIEDTDVKNKKITTETLHGLAQLLDSEGIQHGKNIDEILKKQSGKVR